MSKKNIPQNFFIFQHPQWKTTPKLFFIHACTLDDSSRPPQSTDQSTIKNQDPMHKVLSSQEANFRKQDDLNNAQTRPVQAHLSRKRDGPYLNLSWDDPMVIAKTTSLYQTVGILLLNTKTALQSCKQMHQWGYNSAELFSLNCCQDSHNVLSYR